MTYCVGIMLDSGLILASDSRTHAGVDNFAKFCKMTVFERPGDRVLVLLSSGNLAGTQAVIGVLRQRADAGGDVPSLWTARTMFDVAMLVSDAMRDIERRDGPYLAEGQRRSTRRSSSAARSRASRRGSSASMPKGNFIEAAIETPYLQTGETKYGKPIIDRVITRHTALLDAAKCVLVSFDSTMRSNLSVGMPIDLICYRARQPRVRHAPPLRRRRPVLRGAQQRVARWRPGGVQPAARFAMMTPMARRCREGKQ